MGYLRRLDRTGHHLFHHQLAFGVQKKPFKLVELAAAVEHELGKLGRQQRPWNVTPIRSAKAKRGSG